MLWLFWNIVQRNLHSLTEYFMYLSLNCMIPSTYTPRNMHTVLCWQGLALFLCWLPIAVTVSCTFYQYRDRITEDDIIGTQFLEVSHISSPGDHGIQLLFFLFFFLSSLKIRVPILTGTIVLYLHYNSYAESRMQWSVIEIQTTKECFWMTITYITPGIRHFSIYRMISYRVTVAFFQ